MAEDEGARAMLREVIAQTCALVAPPVCPCGEEGTWLCGRCVALLEVEPRRVESSCDALQVLTAARIREERRDDLVLPAGVDHTPLLPVLALGEYGGDLQRLVLAWKNGGMLHLGARIAPALAPAVALLAAGASPPGLVPVPSRRSARLRRGEDHTAELARAIERTGTGYALPLRARPTTGQDGQGARQRRTRRIHLGGRRARAAGRRSEPVIIIDDVVTTGSTLRGMHEALTAAGMDVLGAVVVAAARVPAPPSAPASSMASAQAPLPAPAPTPGRAPAPGAPQLPAPRGEHLQDTGRGTNGQKTPKESWHACVTRHIRAGPPSPGGATPSRRAIAAGLRAAAS